MKLWVFWITNISILCYFLVSKDQISKSIKILLDKLIFIIKKVKNILKIKMIERKESISDDRQSFISASKPHTQSNPTAHKRNNMWAFLNRKNWNNKGIYIIS